MLPLLYVSTLTHFTVFGMFLAGLQLYLVDGLGASESMVGLTVGAFFFSSVALRPMIGRRIDRVGRRPFLIGSLLAFAVATGLFVLASSVPVMILLRLLQGAAGGTMYTTAASIVVDLTPPTRRGHAIARFSLFLYGGIALGAVIAEQSSRAIGFPATWLVATALAVVALAFAVPIPESSKVSEHRSAPAGIGRIVHPMALVPGLVLLMPSIAFAGVAGFGSLYAREIGLATPDLLYAALALTVIVVRLFAGALADRHGHRRASYPSLGFTICGLALLAWSPIPAAAVVAVMLFGVGFALLLPALLAFVANAVPEPERAEALATFTAFLDLGMGLGGYLVGAIAQVSSFASAYTLTALLCLVSVGLLLRVPAMPAGLSGEADPAS